jgi:hypothetical protein
MSLFEEDSSALFGAVDLAEDLRCNERAKFRKNVSISPVGSSLTFTATLIDLSRDGLYFTTRSQRFDVGAQLRVTLPNSSECICEVVRVEELPSAGIGVGLRIVSW